MKHSEKKATRILAIVLMLFCVNLGLFAAGGGESGAVPTAEGEQGYRFIGAYGPWDLSEGRIDIEKQPNDPYFQYVEKATGAASLTISWEWEGVTGYVQGLRLYMASGDMPDYMKIASQELAVELIENDISAGHRACLLGAPDARRRLANHRQVDVPVHAQGKWR